MHGIQSSWLNNHPDFTSGGADTVDTTITQGLLIASGVNPFKPDQTMLDSVEYPKKFNDVFEGSARYRVAYGGRGSAKSFTFATMLAVRGTLKKEKILCGREIQKSIDQSCMAQIIKVIEKYPFLDSFYDVGKSFIRGKNGTEFIFKGLHHDPQSIKSMEGITIAWIEEAETVSEPSWRVLTPTIREPGSEIWVTFNPEASDSATHKRFIDNPPANSRIIKINFDENPWFPVELEAERVGDFETRSPEYYEHVWLGECITISDAQIFAGKWSVQDFTPRHDWDGPYQGLDFGFSNDPTCAVRCWIYDRDLYIEYDNGQTHIELDDISKYMRGHIPTFEDYVTRADSSRPDTISKLKKQVDGLPRIIACTKPKGQKGSIIEGIEHILSFNRIIIHPRCEDMTKEARLYSYKVDKQSGDVLPVVVDAWNHRWDSVRYALEPVMTSTFSDYGKIL